MKYWCKALLWISSASLTLGQACAAVQPTCVTGDEVKALSLVLLPEALTAVAGACAKELPESAFLRRADSPMFERYRAQSAPNMELARSAFAKISGASGAALLKDDGLEMMTTLLLPKLIAEVKPKDCGAISTMIELVAPLPPENMGGIISTILQLVARDEADRAKRAEPAGKSAKSNPDICPYTEAL